MNLVQNFMFTHEKFQQSATIWLVDNQIHTIAAEIRQFEVL